MATSRSSRSVAAALMTRTSSSRPIASKPSSHTKPRPRAKYLPLYESSSTMKPQPKTETATANVQFKVHLNGDETPSGESPNLVWLVGSIPSLGAWIPSQALPMSRVVKNHSHGHRGSDGMTWAVDAMLPIRERVKYRYFVGQHSHLIPNKVIVSKWEAFVKPRSYIFNPEPKKKGKEAKVVEIEDIFGKEGCHSEVDIGWLTTQLEVRLSFLHNPIRWWKKRHQTQKYTMKVSATDPKSSGESSVEPSSSIDSLQDYALMHEDQEGILCPIKYAVLTAPQKETNAVERDKREQTEKENIRGYHIQKQFGVPLGVDDNLIFKVQTEDPQNLFFTIDFFALDHPKSSENAPYYAGSSHILYANFKSEEGQISAPIFGRNSSPIGQVTFNYLVIRPLQSTVLDMHRSRFYHWEQGRESLEVGHRGMGSSYKLLVGDTNRSLISHFRENTIRSLVEAGRCGADFVECDVQLTKDKIPVIYHDFNLKVNLRKRVANNMDDSKDSNFELCNMAVKDLTMRQLQSLQTYHSSVEESGTRDWRTDQSAADSEEPDDLLPFPTLENVLNTLDKEVGVNVEIKYPQFIDLGVDGLEHEQMHFFDRNDYLDTILQTLLRHSGERRVIISCFDSDACIMLKKKQNRFPVLFLTQGQSQKYPPYKDFRTLSIPAAIKFALAEHLVGINVHTEDLLRDSSWIAETKRAGLVLFCWGEDNNDRRNIQFLKSHRVDGIICDRIHEFISPEKKFKDNGGGDQGKGQSNGQGKGRSNGGHDENLNGEVNEDTINTNAADPINTNGNDQH